MFKIFITSRLVRADMKYHIEVYIVHSKKTQGPEGTNDEFCVSV